MRKLCYSTLALTIAFFLPHTSWAQTTSDQIQSFHNILAKINNDMLPMVGDMLTVFQAIAGFGALWFIGYRVWKHLAAAEPIDFFPLFRPFAIALLIFPLYPSMIKLMNGILDPVNLVTREMVKDSNNGVSELLEHRRKSIVNNQEWQNLAGDLGQGEQQWQKYEQQEEGSSVLGSAVNFTLSIFSNSLSYIIKLLLSIILQILYFAAALAIDALRTFHLLILALIGPFVLALSIYDGFQHLLQAWITRYINVFLWLPICNLLGAMIGKIQQEMLKQDLIDTAQGKWGSFGQTDAAYLIFLVIGIVCYFSVPAIANYIVFASGNNAIVSKVNKMAMAGGKAIAGSM